jgi:diguanylate cyclase (GGDEF)-like protein/PAS domain S-box-containing protein
VHADAGYLAATVRRQAALLAVVLVGLVLVLAVLLNALTLRLVVRPMSQLARQLSGKEPGGSERLALDAVHSGDEIGTVVHAANRLLDANQAALSRERAMREEVTAMEARYRQIFDHTSAGIFLLTPDYRLVNSNRAISRLFGIERSGVHRLGEQDFLQALFVDPAVARELVAAALKSGQTTSADLQLRGADGTNRWVHCLITTRNSADGHGYLIEGVLYDVTQRRIVESQFAYMVEHDGLTGLKSRAYFHNALRTYVERARTIHSAVTLIFVDLDQFKLVNDSHGHDAGDLVLVECARRLQDLLHRNTDLAARLGGDEFTIVLDGVGAEEPAAHDLARRIVRAMNQPIEIGAGLRVRVGASVGLASFPLNAADSDELVRAADRAMYEVKRLGKSSWRVAGTPTALAG